jgi:hypothetical protein
VSLHWHGMAIFAIVALLILLVAIRLLLRG